MPGADRRLAEAARAGFTRALVPASTPVEHLAVAPGMEIQQVRTLVDALTLSWSPDMFDDPVDAARLEVCEDDTAGTMPPWSTVGSQPLNDALALIAPGTPLREGLDRILQAKHGALIVVGDDPAVLSICTGGFLLDAEFSPQRLSELAKMDGAIILAADASRIARANVHLMPKATIPTSETGHAAPHGRAGGPVDRRAGHHRLRGHGDHRRLPQRPEAHRPVIGLADRPLEPGAGHLAALPGALRRRPRRRCPAWRSRTPSRSATSSAVLQPGEMVRRIAEEIDGHLVELGSDGRLIHLQTEELSAGVSDSLDAGAARLRRLAPTEPIRRPWPGCDRSRPTPPMDLPQVVATLGLPAPNDQLHAELAPRGYRLLHRLPQLLRGAHRAPGRRASAACPRSCRPSPAELESVEGIGAATARPRARRSGPPGRGQHLRALRVVGRGRPGHVW